VSHANGSGGGLITINEDGSERSSNYWERERRWQKSEKEREKEYSECEADRRR